MLKYIFLTFLIIVFVPQVRRFVFWLLIGRKIINSQKKAEAHFNSQHSKEGEIKVKYNPADARSKRDEGGEYIDYKEIKD